MNPLLKALLGAGRRRPYRKNRPGRSSPRRFIPLLEVLEDRPVPAALLGVEPITWNVIGLDSNNVSAGPNIFPVAVRVRNLSTTDTATNVKAVFNFDALNDPNGLSPYIHLSAGQS